MINDFNSTEAHGWPGHLAGMMRQAGGWQQPIPGRPAGFNPMPMGGMHPYGVPSQGQQYGGAFQMRQQSNQGGYDSSGINPGGMYSGQMPQIPQAPQYGQIAQRFGGYQPMGGLAGMFRGYYGQR